MLALSFILCGILYVYAGTTIKDRRAAYLDSQRPQASALGSTGELKRLYAMSYTDSQPATTPDISTHSCPQSSKVPRMWPEDTDLVDNESGRIRLTIQMPIVRATITEAFELLHASIVLKHAFPDPLLTNRFLVDALSTASLHVPNAEDVHVRLLRDHGYCSKMCTLVCFMCCSVELT
jgi:hypothetical protein